MKNNVWEEQRMLTDVSEFHEKIMSDMDLPKWIKDIKCPFCGKDIPLRSIRNIQLCLNTRNFGDIAIEVLCDDCSKMDTLYFREKCKHISDFVNVLLSYDDGKRENISPKSAPILEEEMYKIQYNNVMEKMIKEQTEE